MTFNKPDNDNICQACGAKHWRWVFVKADYHYFRCLDCGMVAMNPQPDDEALQAIYGHNYFQAWGLLENHELVAKQKRATFKHWLNSLPVPSAGDRLLDVGAATGFLLDVAQEKGYEVYGSEFTDFGSESLKNKFGQERVIAGPFDHRALEKFKPGFFQVVTMTDFLEHSRDPLLALNLAYELLAPGWRLLISTPDVGSISCRSFGKNWPHFNPEHLMIQTRMSLKMLLEKSGFSLIHAGAASKSMAFMYLASQLNRNHWPMINYMMNIFSKTPLKSLQFKFFFGDMLAVAVKSVV